ncbi:hypothetical protein E2C01_065441 [Portunus trituberculatus]|uniref:Uncharacterized protein n=1 Tax=Portunus trituberculatus TaxID=210409 RepID=A0A5B7HEL0_PORTR|nr:hypothetical protein [Portunus trituberculatus]
MKAGGSGLNLTLQVRARRLPVLM